MRFLILIAGVAFTGAVVGATLPAPYAYEIASDADIVRDGAAKVIADPSELNPLRWVFDVVKDDVQSNSGKSDLYLGKSTSTQSWAVNPDMSSGLNFVDPHTHTHNAAVVWHGIPH